MTFEFDYAIRQPDGVLGRWVESLWYARGTVPYTRERIAPTGSTVAIFVLGDPILETADDGRGSAVLTDRGFLVGPHVGPVVNEPQGETYATGIVSTPVGCEALFGLSPRSVRGDVRELEAVWSPATMLRSALCNAPDPESMLDALEQHFAPLGPPPPAVQRIERAVACLEADPTRSISDIAEELTVSHGHLDREFTRVVGLSPRVLARLLRMRRLLEGIDVRSDVEWADRAADLGWFDQAHLIRDFKRHTGVTPTQYLVAQRATFSPVEPGDAAGFVPEV